ncbi:DUF1684 domain-containing protein [soil metagenome]
MKRSVIIISLAFIAGTSFSQSHSYYDSIVAFQQNYKKTLEVIESGDRKYISFFPPDPSYNIIAQFEKVNDTIGFEMNTSTGMKKPYLVYGKASFIINGRLVSLFIYRSKTLMLEEQYADYVFIPFGDATSGITSYGGGRYIDLSIKQIENNSLSIDFNKAYNPYCAYTTGYNCPIPPVENLLNVPIFAGEKNYGKPYH